MQQLVFSILFAITWAGISCREIPVSAYFPELAERATKDGCKLFFERRERNECFKNRNMVRSRTRCLRIDCDYNTEYYQVIIEQLFKFKQQLY